jgi:SSS family solute:Na+ symporter
LFLWVYIHPSALAKVAFSIHAQSMAENLYRALWSWTACVIVTVIVSLCTKPKPISELAGLVYGATQLPEEPPVAFYKHEYFWAAIIIVVFFVLNLIFW